MITLKEVWEKLNPRIWDGLAAMTESVLDYLGERRVTADIPTETSQEWTKGYKTLFWHGRRPILEISFWVHRVRGGEVWSNFRAEIPKGPILLSHRFKSSQLPFLNRLEEDLDWWMNVNGPATAGRDIALLVQKHALGPKDWTPEIK